MSYRSASVSAAIASLEIFCGGSSRYDIRNEPYMPSSHVNARSMGLGVADLDLLPRPSYVETQRVF